MSNSKINKIVMGNGAVKEPPTNDEIRKYGHCLNIKKQTPESKDEVRLTNNYPMTIRNNKLYNR
ncbi:protein F8 [BeAn 58058 virus]|uniref:protein F8 n=1 Tax=BeAn 58058 virus TaxID=67082 RepID=UPI00090C46EC|nr:protein F8 [BeAn 58058 virus]APG58228.1 protein F8 [BeAn 58058 virus]